jgi:hypothetical protein
MKQKKQQVLVVRISIPENIKLNLETKTLSQTVFESMFPESNFKQ